MAAQVLIGGRVFEDLHLYPFQGRLMPFSEVKALYAILLLLDPVQGIKVLFHASRRWSSSGQKLLASFPSLNHVIEQAIRKLNTTRLCL